MPIPFAQVQESLWQPIIQALSMNGMWVFVAVCVLAGTAKHIVHMVLKHRERIAMIEAGMRPDRDGVDVVCREDVGDSESTVCYKSERRA